MTTSRPAALVTGASYGVGAATALYRALEAPSFGAALDAVSASASFADALEKHYVARFKNCGNALCVAAHRTAGPPITAVVEIFWRPPLRG